jgi:hypothetical protein
VRRALGAYLAGVLAFNLAVTVSPFAMLPWLLGISSAQWFFGVLACSLAAGFFLTSFFTQ